jgi:hypothetical protein
MRYLSKIRTLIGFIFVLTIAVVMMIGFSAGVVKAKPFKVPIFDADNFGNPTTIDNTYLPLVQNTTFCYQSETGDGTEIDNMIVTDCDKTITVDGKDIDVVVVRDTATLITDDNPEGMVVEDTFDWFAQDDDGNVWYFGEDTLTCGEEPSSAGLWEAGKIPSDGTDPAIPGIVMLAVPKTGVSYPQEQAAPVAEDMAKVLRLNAKVSVPFGDFKDCLKTKEWTPLSPGDIEHKYYAPDIGLVLVEELMGKTVISELINVDGSGGCPAALKCDIAPTTNCD